MRFLATLALALLEEALWCSGVLNLATLALAQRWRKLATLARAAHPRATLAMALLQLATLALALLSFLARELRIDI